MTSFDHKDGTGSHARLVRHEWSYDNLGRKDASADITVTSPYFSYNKLNFSYDSAGASRLASEALTDGSTSAWSNTYTYDAGENRTEFHDVTHDLLYDHVYGAGNRETGVDGDSSLHLSYDYKGNVTVRPPLAGGASFYYGSVHIFSHILLRE